ncbi:MAG: DNA polymerase III subunit delta [Dehalococcoidia bacterium]
MRGRHYDAVFRSQIVVGIVLYIYHGEDDFSRREALDRLKAELGPAEFLSTNTSVLDGSEATPDHLITLVNTMPFLSEHRLIVVEGLLNRWNSGQARGRRRTGGRRKPSRDLGEWSSLPEALSAMSPTTVLVFTDGPLNPDNPLLGLLAPLGKVTEFPPLRGYRLQKWIQDRVAGARSTISAEALRLLAQVSGGSLWNLAHDIEKLSLYAAGREIDEKDVEKLVAGVRESNIFALIDAIIEGKSERACRELGLLLDAGDTASHILSMIVRQLRLIALSIDLSKRGVPEREMGPRLGIFSEYALGKVLDQSRLYDLPELAQAYEMVLASDLTIKTRDIPERLVLELLVLDLARNHQKGEKRPAAG